MQRVRTKKYSEREREREREFFKKKLEKKKPLKNKPYF